ncbi:hypothetical protein B5K05_05815 [Rhizobium phaseoli]|nr:hypothetical protein CO648_03290 [Rhizobium phaseoli]RDJ16794.1 hypothetical protein B5K04_05785 [Rhizobium phaseoli]RDJ18040.1 hypothetical protein B5K05_05815 [Rhizobium phaseoli]
MPQRTKLCCSKPNSVKEMFWHGCRSPGAGTGRPPRNGWMIRWCYPGTCHIGIRSLLETGASDEDASVPEGKRLLSRYVSM